MFCKRKSLHFLFLAFFFSLHQTTIHASQDLPVNWTVQKAVAYALDNSPDAKAAAKRIEAAKAHITEAKAAFQPKVGITADYGRTNNPMYSFGNILNQGAFDNSMDFNDPGTTDNLQLQGRVEYRLYNGGRDQAGLNAAMSQEQASSKQQTAIHTQLGFEVVQSFYLIAQAQETLQARESAIKAIIESTRVAKARFDEGDLLKADLLNFEVQLARARENRIQADHVLELAKRGFLNLLGLTEGKVEIDLQGSEAQQPPENPDYSSRPELAAMDAVILVHEAELKRARAGTYPTADAFASYQVDQGFELDESGDSYLVGVRLNYLLYEGQATQAATAKATAKLNEARENRRKLALGLNYELEQARLNKEQAEKRVQVTKKMVDLAQESARLSRARFKEGVLLPSDLLDTENRLTEAKLRYSVARSSENIALADLRRAAGLEQF